MQDKFVVIVPAFNEATVIEATLTSIVAFRRKSKLNFDIVVVDDGSSDNTGKLAQKFADAVIRHRKNCGLGASLTTGFEYGKRIGYTSCVTLDADGQHDASDIGKVVEKLNKGCDVVIGSRFLGLKSNMSTARKVILLLSNFITWIFFGVWTSDSQSGFRGLSKRALQSLKLISNSMEVSSEIFGEVKRLGLVLGEVPISVKYTEYSLKKGQKNLNGVKVLLKLVYKLFR